MQLAANLSWMYGALDWPGRFEAGDLVQGHPAREHRRRGVVEEDAVGLIDVVIAPLAPL